MKKISVICILICLCISMAACRDTKENTRIIKDQFGQEVELPHPIKRVVTSMYPLATQMIFLVGAQETLVGISDSDINPVMKEIYPPIVDIYRPGRSSGGAISIEEVIKMRPDVVFSHTHTAYENRLNDMGIPAVCLHLEDPQRLMDGILLVGKIMDHTQRAEEIVTCYREKLAYIHTITGSIHHRKKVYFAGPNMLSTASGDYYQNFLIEYAGGQNVAAEHRGGWSSISIEHLLVWDPDLILVANYGTATVAKFMNDPRLKGITAVKNKQVFLAPQFIGSWDVPTPESLLGIMWLAKKLYPEQITFDMSKEMVEFYSRCYGYTPSREEIARVLKDQA